MSRIVLQDVPGMAFVFKMGPAFGRVPRAAARIVLAGHPWAAFLPAGTSN